MAVGGGCGHAISSGFGRGKQLGLWPSPAASRGGFGRASRRQAGASAAPRDGQWGLLPRLAVISGGFGCALRRSAGALAFVATSGGFGRASWVWRGLRPRDQRGLWPRRAAGIFLHPCGVQWGFLLFLAVTSGSFSRNKQRHFFHASRHTTGAPSAPRGDQRGLRPHLAAIGGGFFCALWQLVVALAARSAGASSAPSGDQRGFFCASRRPAGASSVGCLPSMCSNVGVVCGLPRFHIRASSAACGERRCWGVICLLLVSRVVGVYGD